MSVDAIVETEIEFQDIHIKKPEKTISLESFIPPDNEDKKYSISENGRKGGGNTDVVDDIDGGGGDIGRTEKRITIKIDKKNTKPVQKQRAVAEPRASTKKGQLLKDVLKYRFDERVENINSSERHSSSISNKNNEMDMDIVEEKQTSSPITIDDVKSINDNNMDIDTNDIDINSESFSVFLQQKLIESFLKENSAAELQISSYHNFIEEKIPW